MKQLFITLFLLLSVLAYTNALGYEPNLTGSDWEDLDADSKVEQIDKLIYADNTSTTFYSPVEVAAILLENMNDSFDTVADDMPPEGWPITVERPKLIHTVGAIAPAKFVPVSNPQKQYSGIFADGATDMYVRFSLAASPTTSPPNIVPGISLKFLRDGQKSANIFAMYSLSGQTSFNFFEHDLSNHPPYPNAQNMTFTQSQLLAHFLTASAWPTMLGLSDVARYDQSGKESNPPSFPFRIIFHPYTNIHELFPSTPSSDPEFYIAQLETLTPGPVYYVYAEDPPGGDIFQIGDLYLTAPPSGSQYGDLNLFFQHTRMEADFEVETSWPPLAQRIVNQQASVAGYTYPDLPFN